MTKAQQMLKNKNILTRDPKLGEYFTTKQQNELYDFLSGYMAVAINSSSFSYTGDRNNPVSQKILEKLFDKMGISKKATITGQTLTSPYPLLPKKEPVRSTSPIPYQTMAGVTSASGPSEH